MRDAEDGIAASSYPLGNALSFSLSLSLSPSLSLSLSLFRHFLECPTVLRENRTGLIFVFYCAIFKPMAQNPQCPRCLPASRAAAVFRGVLFQLNYLKCVHLIIMLSDNALNRLSWKLRCESTRHVPASEGAIRRCVVRVLEGDSSP